MEGLCPPGVRSGARRVPPLKNSRARIPPTTRMLIRRARQADARGDRFQPRWVWTPLHRIGAPLQNAVIAAEDSTFYRHRGVEWGLTRAAFLESWTTGRRDRGASTLTQQVARNLYLSPEKTYLRKAREIVLAQRLEQALTKERLLEIYLNIAEWGDGIFGAEAAARAYYGKSAADLTWDEAIAMTAVLPSPRRHRPTDTGRWVASRKAWVLQRLVTTRRYAPPATFPPTETPPPAEDDPLD
jgi:monofunctional biosynthetic peptidoglycan transglycosylase